MKHIVLKSILILFMIVVIIAIANTFHQGIIKKSVKESYVTSSGTRLTQELSLLYLNTDDFIDGEEGELEDLTHFSFEDKVEKLSSWKTEKVDLSLLREEWHFHLFNYLNEVKQESAEKILLKYLSLKNKEIADYKKINDESNKKLKKLTVLVRKKDEKYLRKFYEIQMLKKKKVFALNQKMEERKKELFGNAIFELKKVNRDFNKNLKLRFKRDFNLGRDEIYYIETNSIKKNHTLLPLAL